MVVRGQQKCPNEVLNINDIDQQSIVNITILINNFCDEKHSIKNVVKNRGGNASPMVH